MKVQKYSIWPKGFVVVAGNDDYLKGSGQAGTYPRKNYGINGVLVIGKHLRDKSDEAVVEEDKKDQFTDIFISMLARKVGINCIDSLLIYDKKEDSICLGAPDFGKSHSVKYDFEISVDEYIEKLKEEYQWQDENIIKINYDEIRDQFIKIALFDWLTVQVDRHCENFALIENIKKDLRSGKRIVTVEPAPMFDNGRAFFIDEKLYCKRKIKIVPSCLGDNYAQPIALIQDENKEFFDKFKSIFESGNYEKFKKEFIDFFDLNNPMLKDYFPNKDKWLDRFKEIADSRIRICEMRKDNLPPEYYIALLSKNHLRSETTELWAARYKKFLENHFWYCDEFPFDISKCEEPSIEDMVLIRKNATRTKRNVDKFIKENKIKYVVETEYWRCVYFNKKPTINELIPKRLDSSVISTEELVSPVVQKKYPLNTPFNTLRRKKIIANIQTAVKNAEALKSVLHK